MKIIYKYNWNISYFWTIRNNSDFFFSGFSHFRLYFKKSAFYVILLYKKNTYSAAQIYGEIE